MPYYLDNGDVSLKIEGTLGEHISSVKSLSVAPSSAGDSKRLLFSGGGRASLKVWLVNTNIEQGNTLLLYITVLMYTLCICNVR